MDQGESGLKSASSVRVPVLLAGGLDPDNVARAIKQVRPYGVDICSGVRTKGKLNPQKLARFIANVTAV